MQLYKKSENLPDSLDLVYFVLGNQLIELRVQFVEHSHHLHGPHFATHRREAYDIREEYGN